MRPDRYGSPGDPYAERPPGRPPWAPGMSPAGKAFVVVLGLAAASALVSAGVCAWRMLDRIIDLR